MAEPGASDSNGSEFRPPTAKRNADAADSGAESDQDFDPSADMLIHDFDDEHTLDEEEAMDDPSNEDEIDELQKEGEMPLEELLALYRYGPPASAEPDNEEQGQAGVSSTSEGAEAVCDQSASGSSKRLHLDTNQITASNATVGSDSSRLSRFIDSSGELASDDEDDEEDDEEDGVESLTGDWRKNIQVGAEYQANVPSDICPYTSDSETELGDKLLWTPGNLPDKVIQDYLREYAVKVHNLNLVPNTNSVNLTNKGDSNNVEASNQKPDSTRTFSRDDEHALWILYHSGYNIPSALERISEKPKIEEFLTSSDHMRPWSEIECRQFEEGLKIHGKDFVNIQKSRLPNRSVNEIVHFYYLWKKTERHDELVAKHRIEKKQYALNPSVTDFMNRFLDEQEAISIANSVSSGQASGSTVNPSSASRSLLMNGVQSVAPVGPDSSSSSSANSSTATNGVSSSTSGACDL